MIQLRASRRTHPAPTFSFDHSGAAQKVEKKIEKKISAETRVATARCLAVETPFRHGNNDSNNKKSHGSVRRESVLYVCVQVCIKLIRTLLGKHYLISRARDYSAPNGFKIEVPQPEGNGAEWYDVKDPATQQTVHVPQT